MLLHSDVKGFCYHFT